MLDIKFIRENLDRVKRDTANKNLKVDFDLLLKLDDQRRNIISKIDELRAGRNKLAEAMKKERNPEMIEESRKNKEEVIKLEKESEQISDEYDKLLLSVPNVVAEDVPVGKNEDENVVLRKWGEPKKFNFKIKDHVELGKELDIIDTEKSALISGPRFFYLKNAAVFLQFAIINLVLTTLTDKKIISKLAKKVGNPFDKLFSPILPPVMIKPQIMKKMDRLDPIEERYYIPSDNVVLIGSAEHTMGPLHMDETLEEKNLPVRYIGYSTNFRREAGSYGKDMKGILRTHQFDKLEMESYAAPEFGKAEQDLIVAIQEYLLQQLELPYRVMALCAGDSGKPDYRQIDMECWIPSQNKYRETHTSDFMTDYQSRRLNIKCKNEKGEKRFVYMNDATAFAIGRTLIAILENNQTAKGTVIVPKALRKFAGIKEIKKA